MKPSNHMQEVLQQEADFYGMDQSCMDMLAERMAAKQQEAQQLARNRWAAAAAAARAASPPPLPQSPQHRTRIEVVDLDEEAPIKHPALRGTSPQRMRVVSTYERNVRLWDCPRGILAHDRLVSSYMTHGNAA